MKRFLILISLAILPLAPVAGAGQAAAVQRYFLVNADYWVYNYPYINEIFGPQSGKEIAVGNAALFYVFNRPMETFEEALKKHFRMAEEYDIPLLVQFDPFTFWSDVPELWNWWDPDKPGYNPDNRENVEWYGWSSDCAVKLGWLNWGRQLRILPMANVYSPAYQEALKERMARFMTWIKEWRDSLPEDKQYLFVGVKMTGELTFGVNNWYYEGGNELFELPEADDPQTGIRVKDLPDRGVAQTGYAALKYSGIKTEGEVTAGDIFELERRFAGFMGGLAQGYGIPRDLIYSHASGAAGDLASPIQSMTCPSWSFYHEEAINPQDSPQYKEYLPLSDAPNWAVSEWNFFNPSREIWEQALRNCYSLPGNRFVTVYNYDSVFKVSRDGRLTVLDGPVSAIRALQDGSSLDVGAEPARLPDDLARLAGDPALLNKPEGLQVASYVFPNYCPTALHDRLYAPGWTEYNLVRSARPWFEGHDQPRTPLLGELDESLPSTWEVYNRLCKQSGIDVLIWDWYWYDGRPCLHEALENGFLASPNREDVKFACMWTNHDWFILYPSWKPDGKVAYPPSFVAPDFSYEEAFRSLAYIVTRYFAESNYWRLDGKPVLCIWDAARLEKKVGLDGVKHLLADLEDLALKQGYSGIHFHIVGFTSEHNREAGYQTSGSYSPLNWIAGRQPKEVLFPDYREAAATIAFEVWDSEYKRHGTPFFPAVATGWDSTPRYINQYPRTEVLDRNRWPGCNILAHESPAAFKAFVQASFWYLNRHPEIPPVLTIACFNEWSEGHYMLPDNRFGYGMLDALAEALGKGDPHQHHGFAE